MTHINQPTDTPNVVISNSRVRFWAGLVLYGLAVAIQVFSIFAGGTVFGAEAAPWVDKTGDAITLLAAVFGLAVSTPNVPRAIK